MIVDILTALEESAPAQLLRGSFWVYPLVNAAHIFGLALLLGAILPLDLRLLGFFRVCKIRLLARVLVPVAATGLAVAVVSGGALFIVKPLDYASSEVFLIKLGLIGAGFMNIAWVRVNPRWVELVQLDESILNPTEPNLKLRIAGAISIAVWAGVLVLGRLIGYLT